MVDNSYRAQAILSAARSAFSKRVQTANSRGRASPAPLNYSMATDVFQTASHQDPPLPTTNNNPYLRNHPMNNQKNHLALLQHVMDRCIYAKSAMEQRGSRFSIIDRELAGFLKLEEEDRRRDRDNKRGKGVRPVDTKLTLGLTQLDECLTFLMSVFAPEQGLFQAEAAKPNDQAIANAFVHRMNMDAKKFKYYREYAKAFLNMLKYNVGGWLVDWREIRGIVFDQDNMNPAGGPVRRTDVTWRGNSIRSLDMYNILWDPTVHPVDLNSRGEYFATVDIYRKFDILRMAANKEIYDVWKFVNYGQINARFYIRKPDIRIETDGYGSVTGAGNTDWFKIMSGGVLGDVSKGYELVNFYGWLIPKKFGLSNSTDLEVWRITVANSNCICRTEPVDTTHGLLPCAFGSPIEDDLGLQQKSLAEQLLPLQTFASSLINVHQRANRKGLYGLTFYNPNTVPLGDKTHEELESGKVPIKPPGYGDFDIRKHVLQLVDTPKTERTMEDLDNIIKLMQKVLPTDIIKQVADIQRATVYQAASVVQGTNRRNLKMAKMIEDQAMSDVRFMCMYNIYDKLTEPLEYTDPKTNQSMTFTPMQVIQAGIEFAISEGLKGIDKMYIIEVYKELVGIIAQSQQAQGRYDIVGLVNYIGSLMGDTTDITKFQITNPLDQLDPQTQQILGQLAQTGQLQPLLQAYQRTQQQPGSPADNAAKNVVPLKGTPGQSQSILGQPGSGQPALGGDD